MILKLKDLEVGQRFTLKRTGEKFTLLKKQFFTKQYNNYRVFDETLKIDRSLNFQCIVNKI